MTFRILNMADFAACPEAKNALDGLGDVVTLPAEQDVLQRHIAEFDGYFASLHVRLDSDTLARASRLKFVATPSTGHDHLDVEELKRRGIALISVKDDTLFLDSVTATAEMAWALLLATARQLPWSFEAARAGQWARDEFRGHQLSGKTLGILGYGRLGRIVAEYGKAFRMRVLACDRRAVEAAPGVTMVDLDTLLCESDALSIHIHLTPENRHLLGAAEFARMKPGALLVNTSRGAILDEIALLAALNSGTLGGAGLDVIDGEWDEQLRRHPLIEYANTHRNLVISPHTGGLTYESQHMVYLHTIEKLAAFLRDSSNS